jgi:hypothetical protein
VISGHIDRDVFAHHLKDTQYEFRIAYRILCKVEAIVVGLLLVVIGLSACSEQPTPFRPPSSASRVTATAQVSATPTSTLQAIETPLPTATAACTNALTFLEAISIPDGTVVHIGDHVDKRWLVQNSGSCNWDDRYRLRSIAGTGLNTPAELALYPARSGAKASIRVQFTAPSDPGSYQSSWQAYNPQGQPFGDPLNILIVVESEEP